MRLEALEGTYALAAFTPLMGRHQSTICARLAGQIRGAALLDADILGEHHASVVTTNPDYAAFWRALMRLAHELSQNDLVVAYFSVMLPEQVLVNVETLGYFDSVHFLCLTAPPEVLRTRVARQAGTIALTTNIDAYLDERAAFWKDFNTQLFAAASDTPNTTLVDATRPTAEVEHDVRAWINELMPRRS